MAHLRERESVNGEGKSQVKVSNGTESFRKMALDPWWRHFNLMVRRVLSFSQKGKEHADLLVPMHTVGHKQGSVVALS